MKIHRMPFKYWDDEHTVLIKKSKPPEFADPDFYVEAHFHPPGSDKPFFLNRRCRKLYDRQGPFSGRYHDGGELVDRYAGQDAFIFCPGPSLADVPVEAFKSKMTMAVNSAGFAMDPTFWVMAESGYARWLIKDQVANIPKDRTIISTGRVAVCLRDFDEKRKKPLFPWVWVVRWEEEKVVPPRVPAVSVFNALVSAWEMGCKRAFLLGLDLSKASGPYLDGVPFTKEGAANPFDDQVLALSQFKMPRMEVLNCSPVSKDILPFQYISHEEVLRDPTF